MEKRVHVRSHTRRAPTRKPPARHGERFALFVVAVLGIAFLAWVLSRIPLYVYQILAGIVAIAVVLVVAFLVGLAIRRRRQEHLAELATQEQLRQRQRDQQQRERRTDEAQYTQELEMRLQLECERMSLTRKLGDILTLTPSQFEAFIGTFLDECGYHNVQCVGRSGDLGVDLLARDSLLRRVAVQCKKFSPGRSVGSRDLQNFIGMMTVEHKAERGIFITTSDYTRPAKDLASKHRDKLIIINGELLVELLQQTKNLPELQQ